MTIVATYDDGKTICLGSDSCGICAGTKMEFGPKIIKKSNYYIGFADSYRVADILKESKFIPNKINKLKDIQDIRDAIRQELISKIGASENDSEPDGVLTHPISIIIASKLGIHEIQNDYAILKPKDKFDAIGAGREIAIGCLATHKLYSIDAYTAVKETLKITAKFCTDCGGKLHIVRIQK